MFTVSQAFPPPPPPPGGSGAIWSSLFLEQEKIIALTIVMDDTIDKSFLIRFIIMVMINDFRTGYLDMGFVCIEAKGLPAKKFAVFFSPFKCIMEG